jgi:hypothetical protein
VAPAINWLPTKGAASTSDLTDSAFGLNESRLLHVQQAIEEIDALFLRVRSSHVSNAVLEEIYDTDAAFRAMDRPGAWRTDARDRLARLRDVHEARFSARILTVPDSIYQVLRRNRSVSRTVAWSTTIEPLWRCSAIRRRFTLPDCRRAPAWRPPEPLSKGVDYSEETSRAQAEISQGCSSAIVNCEMKILSWQAFSRGSEPSSSAF